MKISACLKEMLQAEPSPWGNHLLAFAWALIMLGSTGSALIPEHHGKWHYPVLAAGALLNTILYGVRAYQQDLDRKQRKREDQDKPA